MSTTLTSRDVRTTWQIDAAHTQVEFEVKHMMFAKVRGRFTAFEGHIDFDAEDVAGSEVEVSIDAASIDTGQGQRDEHLRSADFFDVEKFPKLTFKSTAVRKDADGSLRVIGDLTIRDVTREVELHVTETGRGTDPWGNDRVGFAAKTAIDRRDFGLTWNQALEAGGVLVGHEVKISLEVQAVSQAS